MDPKAGLIFAVLAGSAVMMAWGDVITQAVMGSLDHGRAQAASEIRRARQAVIGSTKSGLRRHLEDGRKAGPLKSGWWWAYATARSARAARRAVRRPGSRSRSLPSAGPLRRIIDAAVAGARLRARQARARRPARPGIRGRARQAWRNATAWRAARRHQPGDVATGVCDRCGVTAAITALEYDGPHLLCALCRAPAVPDDAGIPEAAEAPGIPGASEGIGVAEGELVPVPAMADPASPVINMNGAHMAGAIARRTAAPAVTSRAGGDITTHGDWDRLTRQVAEALNVTGRCKEAMLGNLKAADAGRTQMADIREWADRTQGVITFIRSMLADVNGRIGPLIDAVSAAGGPDEVASPAYHSDY